jgi:hypothetical protein
MNPVYELFDVASAVEQRVIAMQMQVDELVLAHEDLGFILKAGGNRAMPESGAIVSR